MQDMIPTCLENGIWDIAMKVSVLKTVVSTLRLGLWEQALIISLIKPPDLKSTITGMEKLWYP